MPDEKSTNIPEIWKPVTEPGFETIYSISNLGRVRREIAATNTYKGKILKSSIDPGGYPQVGLRGHGYSHGFNSRVGTSNPRAKLSEENVKEIRSLAKHISQRKIAEKFGVSQPTISLIVHRIYWSHVE